jgi:hypothetical protein
MTTNNNTENLIAEVEPGVVTEDFQKAVEKLGLFYPPDPASGIAPEGFYGLREDSHLEELVTDIFTNPALIEAMQGIQVKQLGEQSKITKAIKTMWDKVTRLVNDILRGGEINHPVVKEIMELGTGLMVVNDKISGNDTKGNISALIDRTQARILDHTNDHPGAKYEDLSKPNREDASAFTRTISSIRAAILGGAKRAGTEEGAASGNVQQENAAKTWAVLQGKHLDSKAFIDEWRRQQSADPKGVFNGAEQQVVIPTQPDGSKKVVKLKHLLPHETWLSYLDRLEAHNNIFPDVAYKLDGFTSVPIDGKPVLHGQVVQPFVERMVELDKDGKPKLDKDGNPIPVPATEQQITDYMLYKDARRG